MIEEQLVAWGLYLVAVLAAQFLLWQLISGLASARLKLIIHAVFFSLLITPVKGEESAGYWVPAIIAALLEGINNGLDSIYPRVWPILLTMLVLVLFSLTLSRKVSGLSRKPRSGPGGAANRQA